MIRSEKAVDVIRASSANWGKSTLADMMILTFPGAAYKASASTLQRESSRLYNELGAKLTECLWVFLDEVDKAELKTASYMELSNAQDIRRLYQSGYTADRLGTAVVMGNDWPHVDADTRGFKERLKWAFSTDDKSTLTDSDRALFLRPEIIDCLRAWMVEEAMRHYNEDTNGTGVASHEACESYVLARTSPITTALKEHFAEGDGFVASGYIMETVNQYVDKEPTPKELAAKIAATFPMSSNGLKREDGKPTRGYEGIVRRER